MKRRAEEHDSRGTINMRVERREGKGKSEGK